MPWQLCPVLRQSQEPSELSSSWMRGAGLLQPHCSALLCLLSSAAALSVLEGVLEHFLLPAFPSNWH